MKFHEFTTLYSCAKRMDRVSCSALEYYESHWKNILSLPEGSLFRQQQARIIAPQYNWHISKRPYFNVWPAIAKSLCNLDMRKVAFSSCEYPEATFCIRFCSGRESVRIGERVCKSILVHTGGLSARTGERVSLMLQMEWSDTEDENGIPDFVTAVHNIDEPVENMVITKTDSWNSSAPEVLGKCFQLVVAIGLMAKDPSIVQPEVLSKDAERYQRTLDPKLIEKAIRNGKHGWNVGKDIESMPHYRRPHFAIRWTGKGSAIPKIVPVKGAVVHREVMTKVPTGYLDNEQDSGQNQPTPDRFKAACT